MKRFVIVDNKIYDTAFPFQSGRGVTYRYFVKDRKLYFFEESLVDRTYCVSYLVGDIQYESNDFVQVASYLSHREHTIFQINEDGTLTLKEQKQPTLETLGYEVMTAYQLLGVSYIEYRKGDSLIKFIIERDGTAYYLTYETKVDAILAAALMHHLTDL